MSTDETWKEIVEKTIGPIHPIYILETNIDDIRGEVLGAFISEIMESGALDVYLINTITKKNRPGYLIRIICQKDDIPTLIQFIIHKTGTLGVRIKKEERVCIFRKLHKIHVHFSRQMFEIPIKCGYDPQGNLISRKIEFDVLKEIQSQINQPLQLIEQEIYKHLSSFSA
jgi:pyridinium-3,5-bisthiocarboxylic acid mononucleotide nickel chelatase